MIFLLGKQPLLEESITDLCHQFRLLYPSIHNAQCFDSVSRMSNLMEDLRFYKKDWRKPEHSLGEGMRLVQALEVGLSRECTDQRDYVYAFHALIGSSREPFDVNYIDPPSILAMKVTVALLAEGLYDVALLGSMGTRRPLDADTSSWAWQLQKTNQLGWEIGRYLRNGLDRCHCAGGHSSEVRMSVCSEHESLSCLRAAGHTIDSIRLVSVPFPSRDRSGTYPRFSTARPFNTTEELHMNPLIINAWASRVMLLINDYVEGPENDKHMCLWMTLWKVIMHDTDEIAGTRIPFNTLKDAVEAFVRSVKHSKAAYRESVGYVPEDMTPLDDEVTRIHKYLTDFEFLVERELSGTYTFSDTIVAHFDSMMHEVATSAPAHVFLRNDKLPERCICVTAAGRIGTVPECAVEGDLVVVVRGISMPYILRRYEDKYRIVGYGKSFSHRSLSSEMTMGY